MPTLPNHPDLGKVSERDKEILILAVQSVRGGEPKIDYARLADAAGLPNPKRASDAWYNLKKRLQLRFEDAAPAAGASGAKKAATSTRTKRKAADGKAEGDEDEKEAVGETSQAPLNGVGQQDNQASPHKKPKGRKGVAVPIARGGRGGTGKKTKAAEDADSQDGSLNEEDE